MVRDALQAECSADQFAQWIKPIVFVERLDGCVRLRVPTVFMRDWIVGHFGEMLRKAWDGAVDDVEVETVEIVVGVCTPETPSAAG